MFQPYPLEQFFENEIQQYIVDECCNTKYSYDEFYEHLWLLQDDCNFIDNLITKFENDELNTMGNCLYMMKQIKQHFECETKIEMNYIICSFVCVIVSNNCSIFYDEYKKIYNFQKLGTNYDTVVDECCICLENKILEETKCKHRFCNNCLFEISKCSMCRKQLVEIFEDYPETSDDDDDDDE